MLHPGIVDENVDLARLCHHRLDLRHIGQVGTRMGRAQLRAQCGDLRFVTEAIEHHFGALCRQRPGDREPDPAGRAGDECALTLKQLTV